MTKLKSDEEKGILEGASNSHKSAYPGAYSVSDPIDLFPPFTVKMRRLLKSTCTQKRLNWDKEFIPGEIQLFNRKKKDLSILSK